MASVCLGIGSWYLGNVYKYNKKKIYFLLKTPWLWDEPRFTSKSYGHESCSMNSDIETKIVSTLSKNKFKVKNRNLTYFEKNPYEQVKNRKIKILKRFGLLIVLNWT